jgi:hypothetical protein
MIPAAIERAVQEKVQCVEIRQLESIDGAVDHSVEMRGDGLLRHELLENGIPARLQRDDPDIGGVALVSRSGVRDVDKADLHRIATSVFTTRLSTSAGQ